MRRRRGYTLTELLVATTLSAVAAAGGLGALHAASQARQGAHARRALAQRVDQASGRAAAGDACGVLRALGAAMRPCEPGSLVAGSAWTGNVGSGPAPWRARWSSVGGGVLRLDVEGKLPDGKEWNHAFLVPSSP